MSAQLSLALEVYRVHCFACPYFVEGASPDRAHDAMEVHYNQRHQALIRSLL